MTFNERSTEETSYALPSRNLSRTGIALLAGKFVYNNTQCVVELPTLGGKRAYVKGRVARCRYVEGSPNLHEIGIRFDQPIDVTKYCSDAATQNFLVVDHDPAQVKLLKHLLKPQAIEIVNATAANEAVAMVASGWFDVALVHHDPPAVDGLAIVSALRRAGFRRPIVGMMPLIDGSIPQACRAAGCTTYLMKPVNLDDLLRVIDAVRMPALHSDYHEDPELGDLIARYVNELPKRLEDLHHALEARDWAALERLMRIVGGEGQAFGFRPISDAAAALAQQLGAEADTIALQRCVDELVKLCNAARAPQSQ